MNLPPEFRERLITEFRLAESKMGESKSVAEMLYYFSILHGEAARILNWHWARELALIWMVIQQTQNAIAGRFTAFTQGDQVVILGDEFFEALTKGVGELADWVEKDNGEDELCRIMTRFSELAYSTTGNGYFLLTKGYFKL